MTRLIIWLSLAAVLSGCSLSKKAEIEIRGAALRHAFAAEIANWESNGNKRTEIAKWLFVVECDKHSAEVIGSLVDYPVVADVTRLGRDDMSFVEPESGRFVAFWRIKKIIRSEGGIYLVDVGCIKGGLNGYGRMLALKKVSGRWMVISSTPTWVS